MNPAELTLFTTNAQSAGFRLHRFEMYNWGAFHREVYALSLLGENALLTGANGAGKTTLVDALITLLNPSPERYFNQSAGFEDRKRTRKLEDYVRGVYGHSASGREQLRDKPDHAPDYTVLLGVFYNNDLKQYYTLAHLYWIKNNELQKRYYTAPIDLNIQMHFRFGGDIRNFNAAAKNAQCRVHDTFNEFALDFQQKLGMRQPERANNLAGRTKPLHLLAKTAGIKVLGNLDGFIRDNMLDETNLDDKFNQLKKEYTDIFETQQTLDKLSEQEKMLMPLLEYYTAYVSAQVEKEELRQAKAAAGPWFAAQYTVLLEKDIARLQQECALKIAMFQECEEKLGMLREDEFSVKSKIDNNDEGRRIRELENQQRQLSERLEQRRKDAGRYAELARALSLIAEPDGPAFIQQKGQLEEQALQLFAQKDHLTEQRDALVEQEKSKIRESIHIERELQSLRQRHNNLPDELIQLRNRLCAGTNINENDLPFVGELLQVRESERAVWERALEKLLQPFSLHLLVPLRYLRAVAQWVRRNDLGTVLRFVEADDRAGEPLSNDHNPTIAANKLDVQPCSIYANWLRNELNRRYSHRCTEDNGEYEKHQQALTPEGLYKNGRKHQKDDRKHRQNFVLGWDNSDKIRQLDNEMRGLQLEVDRIKERIRPLQERSRQLDGKITDLKRLGDFSEFKRIDYKDTENDIQDTRAEIAQLSESSLQLTALRRQLHRMEADIKTESNRRDTLLKNQQELDSQLKNRLATLHTKQNESQTTQTDHHFLPYIGCLPELELNNIERVEHECITAIRSRTDQIEKNLTNLRLQIEHIMHEFRYPKKNIHERFPSWSSDTDALGNPVLDNVGSYTALLDRIQQDELPVLRERYQHRAGQDIGNAMQAFQRQLEDQLNDHRDNITNINQSLRALSYTHDTYLEVVLEDQSRKGRIGEFYQLLRSWDYDRAAFLAATETQQADIMRETVHKIGAIIRRLDENEFWRKEVTDVRNWLNFKTQQRYQRDESPVAGSLLDGTGGKSGGEQAKLTYTVLAAALAYQFNISSDHRNARSFRFIVVDEAFSKLDPENSEYLLNLLSSLHFQMLIITPGISVPKGEQRMSHLIFVQKTQENPPHSSAWIYSIKELNGRPS